MVVALGVLLCVACFLVGWTDAARRRAERELERVKRDKIVADRLAVRERSEAMRREVQLAGCGVAALGGIGPEHLARKGQYGWSPAYQDVVDLRREVEALRQARDHALELLASEPSTAPAEEVLRASREAAALLKPDRSA